MNVKEYLEEKKIKIFTITIDGEEFQAQLNKHDCWEITGEMDNGVEIYYKTPPRWAFTRVMQFLGNVVEARIV